MRQGVAKVHYFVTRAVNRSFVAMLTHDEIRAEVIAGRFSADWFATESDGRSFIQFQKSGDQARWRTLTELLEESPSSVVSEPEPAPSPRPGKLLSANFVGGGASWLLLLVGQFVAGLGFAVIPIGTVYHLGQLAETEKAFGRVGVIDAGRGGENPDGSKASMAVSISRGWVIATGLMSFFLSAALFVVFKRANSLAQVASDQDSDNREVWLAIEELRLRIGRESLIHAPGMIPKCPDF
jgi:hypothetical protein